MQSVRAWEWRQLHRTPLTDRTRGFAEFRAMGGRTISLDLSYAVDISELPAARRAAAGPEYR